MTSLNPLFFNKQGKKLSDEGVSYIINKYVVKGRKERPNLFKGSITPHTFRHYGERFKMVSEPTYS